MKPSCTMPLHIFEGSSHVFSKTSLHTVPSDNASACATFPRGPITTSWFTSALKLATSLRGPTLKAIILMSSGQQDDHCISIPAAWLQCCVLGGMEVPSICRGHMKEKDGSDTRKCIGAPKIPPSLVWKWPERNGAPPTYMTGESQ